MAQYLYRLQPTRLGMLQFPNEVESAALDAHQDYLAAWFKDGDAIFAGTLDTSDSRHAGIVIFEAEDDDAARAAVENDPVVQQRVMRGCWFPYRIALWNPAAATLGMGEELFFYHIQPVRPMMLSEGETDFESELIQAHFEFLKGLTDGGVMCIAGRTLNTDYSAFGLGVLRAGDLRAAWKLSEQDPAVQQRIMRLDIIPFRLSEHFSPV